MGENGEGDRKKSHLGLGLITGAILFIVGFALACTGSYVGWVFCSLGVFMMVIEVVLGLDIPYIQRKKLEIKNKASGSQGTAARPRRTSEFSLWKTKMPWYVVVRPIVDLIFGLIGMMWAGMWISSARSIPYAHEFGSSEILFMRSYFLVLLVLSILLFILGILCLARPASYTGINLGMAVLLIIGGLSAIPVSSRVLGPLSGDYLAIAFSIFFAAAPFILAGLVLTFFNLPVSRWAKMVRRGLIKEPGLRRFTIQISFAVFGLFILGLGFLMLYSSESPWRQQEAEELQKEKQTAMVIRPAAADGMVYVGRDYHEYLYALDAQTGEEVWRFETGSEITKAPVVSDGIVYAVGRENGLLFALDAKTGELIWKHKFDSLKESIPVVSDGMVYITEFKGRLHALDAKTGEEVWDIYPGGLMGSPAVSDGVVYALGPGSSGHALYALDAKNGSELWTSGDGLQLIMYPVVSEGSIYMIDYGNSLHVFDAETGRLEHTFEVEGDYMQPPAVSDGAIYIPRMDAYRLYRLDAETGHVDWFFEKWGAYTPVVSGNTLYLTADRTIYALDTATGGERWHFDEVYSTPAVLEDVVYVGSWSKYLYAIDARTGQMKWKAEVGPIE